MFDPNDWELDTHEHRIYADDTLERYAIVDDIDYQWACQWKWHINKPHPTRTGKKEYFRRSTSWGQNYKPPLYLHVEIMKRTDVLPETEKHILVDHLDGNEFNCRRSNLVWATHVENRNNQHGKRAKQQALHV